MSRSLQVGDVYVTDDAKASFAAAREAEAAARATAADVVTTTANVGLSEQAVTDIQTNVDITTENVRLTGLDRVGTAEDRTFTLSHVRQTTQAVQDATLQVVLAKGEVAKAQTQVGLASDQVELAKQTVAAGRIQFNTRALLYAALNYPDATVAEVTQDGANNGSYRKSGPSGSGSWTLVDQTTTAALLARIVALEAGMAPTKTYPIDLKDVVLTSENTTVILGEDAQRTGDLLLQVIDPVDAAFNFSNDAAAFNTGGSWPQKSGQWVNHGYVGTKAVNGIIRRVTGDTNSGPITAKVNVRVQRLVDAALPSTIVDRIFTRWPNPADQRFKDVLRTEIDYLYGLGILQKIKVWFLPGATLANSMVNLADPNGPLFVPHDGASGSLEFQPYKFMRGNGVDQYIGTQRLPADIGMTLDGHFLAAKAYPGGGFDNGGYTLGNSVAFGIEAARSDTIYGFRSGTGIERNDTPLPNYQWAALSRFNDAANLSGYVDEAKIFTRARALAAMPTRELNFMATNGTSGAAAFTPAPLHGAAAGFGLQDTSVLRFIQANKRIQAVMATIAGA